jgi:hypothetical protein
LSPALEALARHQLSAVKFAQTPAFKALAKQQLTAAKFAQSPAFKALAKEQASAAKFAQSPAFKAMAEQQLRVTRLATSPALRALLERHASAAKFTASPAFRALAEQQFRITKLAESPALKQLAAQQLKAAELTRSASIVAAWQSQLAVARVLSAPSFRSQFLIESREVTDAFAQLGTSQAWSDAIALLRSDPNVSRWATHLGETLDRVEGDASIPGAAANLAEVVSTLPLEELAHASAPLESIASVTASAVEAGLQDIADSADSEEWASAYDAEWTDTVGGGHAEDYRTLLKIWGVGNVVAACAIGAVATGQFVSFLVVLAAIAQISGYSLKDLVGSLRSGDGDV